MLRRRALHGWGVVVFVLSVVLAAGAPSAPALAATGEGAGDKRAGGDAHRSVRDKRRQPVRARAATVTEDDVLRGDRCDFVTGGPTSTGGVPSDRWWCWHEEDLLASLRHRLGPDPAFPMGRTATATERLVGALVADDAETPGLGDVVNVATEARTLRKTAAQLLDVDRAAATTAVESRDELRKLTAALAPAGQDALYPKLAVLPAKLDRLHDDMEAIRAAIVAQGPNAGAPSQPGASDDSPAYVRLASAEALPAQVDGLRDLVHGDLWTMLGLACALAFGYGLYRQVMPRA